jgi:rhamnogalacturonyl hydrolase YesR
MQARPGFPIPNDTKMGFDQLDRDETKRSLDLVQAWVERHQYRGYEPFDGLSSWARPLTFGNLLGQRLLQQMVRQSPLNLRPLMGITPKDSTKGRGYMAWGYLTLYRATGQEWYLEKAIHCLRWLDQHKVPRFKHHSWSNHFDFASRGGYYTKDDPIIVWTSLIGQAYVEAYEITQEKEFLGIAESACRWILELPREKTERGSCISYLADRQSSIHNANMLGGGLLARTGAKIGNKEFLHVARSAMEYSCWRQRSDGSWWYAEKPNHQWIDNFHTGYNLDGLRYYIDSTGDEDLRPNLMKGLKFFKDHFFEPSGRPKYYHSRTYPVDIQCAAQAIDTLAWFSDLDSDCLPLAQRVAAWTVQNMQDSGGHFYYRRYPLIKAKTPMLHWGQATMFKALSQLFLALSVAPAESMPEIKGVAAGS